MEYRILGPLEIRSGRDRLRLANSREQKVVAALLLGADRVVPLPRLVDAVWDDDPPHTAAKAVRNAVSTLRRLLASAGGSGEAISTEPAGYALRIAQDDELDLRAFEHHVSEGRRLSAKGELEAAVDQLRKALALWRGDALAGITGRIVEAAAARLDEQRLTVQEQCLSLELALGRDHQLVDELGALVAAHPLRERPRGQLILALYRAGRRTEALECYRQGRGLLVAELGIEPGPELVELHRAILAGDKGLDAPPRPETQQTHPTPAQLPVGTRAFAGREGQLAELDRLLDPGQLASTVVISAVSGTAGVGKTALAVHWAHRVAHHFPDGQLYVNLRGFDPSGSAMPAAEAVRGFLEALGVPPERVPRDPQAQAGLYRSVLAGRRVLIVLDNARDAEHVRPLLPGTPGCLVVVTSRNQLTSLVTAEGAHPLAVPLLSTAEARQVLAHRIGRARVAAEPQANDELVDLCARLPLAVAIVAARAAVRPRFALADLAAELRQAGGGLDAFAGDDPASNARAVFSWSYHALGAEAARLFRLVGVRPGPDIDTYAAASLAGVATSRARAALAELTEAQLLDEHAAGRYRQHDLLRAYAAELATEEDSEPQRRQALHRVLDHYLHTAFTANRHLYPSRDAITLDAAQPGVSFGPIDDHDHALSWFTAEHANLLAATEQAAANGFDRHTWQLPWTQFTFLDRQGRWHDAVATQHAALAAAGRLDDHAAQALAHRLLGRAYTQLGQYPEAIAHHQRALALGRELADLAGQARAHLALGWVCEQQGRMAEALAHGQHALDLFKSTGNHAWQADALNAVGWYQAQVGDHQGALAPCQQALRLFREVGDREGEASTLDSLGYVHHHLGNHAKATACYAQALELARALGDHYREAETLVHLGDTHSAAGDHDSARQVWRAALSIFDELGHAAADRLRGRLEDGAQAAKVSQTAS